MIVYAAWSQYKSASLLTKAMNDLFEETQQPRKHTWSTVHSFYACMGGFVMDTASPSVEIYTRDSPRLALGCRGVLFVARHGGHIPDISKADIFDRSKADNVGKCLVCLQAGWAIIQCVSRLVCHLPLTLLEINTLGHVLCAFLMYLFWLKKPLEVNEPMVITGEWTHPMCAWLVMSDSLDSGTIKRSIELSGLYVYPSNTREVPSSTGWSPELELDLTCLAIERTAETNVDATVSETVCENTVLKVDEQVQTFAKNPDPSLVCLKDNEVLSGTVFGLRPNFEAREGSIVKSDLRTRILSLDRAAITRWRLASVFISEHPSILTGVD